MTQRQSLGAIAPFFIVSDLQRAIRFYTERLGFELSFSAPEDQPFFAIVRRDAVQIFLKVVSETVAAQPNHTRHEFAIWDAYVYVDDPDALAAELASRRTAFFKPIQDREDGLRGFEVADADGYVLFFGRPR